MKDMSVFKSESGTLGPGTPYYIAPEIVREEPFAYIMFCLYLFIQFFISHSTKSDMWSVRVLLFLLMYLKYPFNGINIFSLGSAIENGRKENPTPEMESRYSYELKFILSSLLETVLFIFLLIFFLMFFIFF
jgi:serine/threonine protein kinase